MTVSEHFLEFCFFASVDDTQLNNYPMYNRDDQHTECGQVVLYTPSAKIVPEQHRGDANIQT